MNDPKNILLLSNVALTKRHNINISDNNIFFLFHINACYLNKSFDGLGHILSCTKNNFDIIAIAETRIRKQVS